MNYQGISNDICLLVEEMNTWLSTIIIPQDEGYLNISSAAMGKLSTVPIGAYNHLTFPKGRSAFFFRFDPKIFNENYESGVRKNMSPIGEQGAYDLNLLLPEVEG